MPVNRFIFGSLPWYSVLVTTGVILALWLTGREQKRLSMPQDMTVDLGLIVLPLGIIGARLYYVIFSWSSFAGDLLSVFRIWEGGLAIYGGVIGGALGVYLYHRIKKLPLGTMCDCIAPGLVLAQSIGRWGNFFNQEAYGWPVTDPAFCFFPAAVFIEEQNAWFMATFFYESVWDLGVFVYLWLTRKKRRRSGDGFLSYLLCYGGGRLIIEQLRMDSLMSAGGSLRVSQLLSVALCITVCAVMAVRAWRRLHLPHRIMSLCFAGLLLAGAAVILFAGLTGVNQLIVCALFTMAAFVFTALHKRLT